MKKMISMALCLCFAISCLACAAQAEASPKPRVVTTIFPPYDFVRSIAGDHVELSMLLPPGSESHSFEPTPQDILKIQSCDVFVYAGGETDAWVERILDSMDTNSITLLSLLDMVDAVEEEIVEGMEEIDEEEEEEAALDEHVWTSPENARRIVRALADTLCALDPANADDYRAGAASYERKLDELDAAIQAVVDGAGRTTLLFGDRFPFRYLAAAYGLSYYAAFPGCATETEASAATIAFLIDKAREENIPVVFQIEFSNGKIAGAISESMGAARRTMHSCHNVSKQDFANGVGYLDLMWQNVDLLKEALQ